MRPKRGNVPVLIPSALGVRGPVDEGCAVDDSIKYGAVGKPRSLPVNDSLAQLAQIQPSPPGLFSPAYRPPRYVRRSTD